MLRDHGILSKTNITAMKDKKKVKPGASHNGNDPKRESTLVTESNPEGAKYDQKKEDVEGPKGKLVDGESTNDGR